MVQKWNAEIVVSAIKSLHEEGSPLNSNHAQTKMRPLYHAARIYHGSWRKAVEAAGISYDSVRVVTPARRVVWNKEIVIQHIQELQAQEEPLHSNHMQTKRIRLYGAACKYFGGWPQAIAAAGLDYDEIRMVVMRTWSTEAITQAIIARVEAGLSISGSVVYEDDRGLYQAAKRHLGTGGWAKARVLAGFTPIDPDPRIIWDTQSVCKEILRFHENGVALNPRAMCAKDYSALYAAGRKVFGTWPKAVAATGLNYEQIRKQHAPWTKEEIIIGIKNLESQGVRLSSKVTQQSHGALFAAAVVKFGCWSEAVEAAGISYRKHSRTWSTKAWLRRMRPDQYQQLLHDAHRHAANRRG